MNRKRINDLVGLSTLLAIVIVLQVIATFIKIGNVSISLALIPIVVGAILYGPKGGTILGFAFGVVVMIMSITGADAGAHYMFNVRPVITCLLCLFKGSMAGLIPALLYKVLRNKNKIVAIVVATIMAPIANTGIFLLSMFTLYQNVLKEWANGTNTALFAMTVLVGFNFLFEFLSNILLSPAVIRIINVRQQSLAEKKGYDEEEDEDDSTL